MSKSTRKKLLAVKWRTEQRIFRRREARRSEPQHQERDADEIASARFPENEAVIWPCMWVGELYAPSQAVALKKGLRKLEGGNTSVFLHPEKASEWLANARSRSSWAYLNLGDFRNRSAISSISHPVDLPAGFESISVELKQLASGVTVLLMRCNFSEEASQSLDVILRRDFSTKVTPIKGRPGAQSIRGPERRKEDELARVRGELRTRARDWIAEISPGLFSGLSEYPAPAWDLVLARKESLINVSGPTDRWRRTLGFGGVLEEWTSEDLTGLVLTTSYSDTSGVVPSFVGIESDALKLLDGEHMGDDIRGLTHLVGDRLLDLLCLWTFDHALTAHEAQFASIRDELAAPSGWRGSGGRLRRLRREVMPLAFDLETLGNASQDEDALLDVQRSAEASFTLAAVASGEEPRESVELADSIRAQVATRGSSIAAQGREVTEALRTQGELLLATTNVRLQRLVMGLTLLVGAAGVYATLSA